MKFNVWNSKISNYMESIRSAQHPARNSNSSLFYAIFCDVELSSRFDLEWMAFQETFHPNCQTETKTGHSNSNSRREIIKCLNGIPHFPHWNVTSLPGLYPFHSFWPFSNWPCKELGYLLSESTKIEIQTTWLRIPSQIPVCLRLTLLWAFSENIEYQNSTFLDLAPRKLTSIHHLAFLNLYEFLTLSPSRPKQCSTIRWSWQMWHARRCSHRGTAIWSAVDRSMRFPMDRTEAGWRSQIDREVSVSSSVRRATG